MRGRPARTAAGLATLLLAGLAACGRGDGPPAAVRSSTAEVAATSTTATSAPAATSTTARRSTTSTTARRATSTTRPGSATPTSTKATGARALSPPAAGTYRYVTSGTTTFGAVAQPFPAVTTLVVDPPSGTVQHSTRDLRDAAANGPATEFTLDYRAQGVYLVALRVTVGIGGGAQSQDFRPTAPVLLLATGARPGAHSEADLQGGTGARLVVDVLRDEQVAVGGQSVDTLVMRAVVALAPGDVTGRQELTVNVDPVSRLWVKERSVLDASAAGGLFKLHSEYTATLQRLTP